MRSITFLIIHCSAVRPGQTSSARQIDQWHSHRGWKGIGYEGGLDADGHPCDTRTPAQKQSLKTLLKQLKTRYPYACIASHHTFDPRKSCPCFDAEHEYIEL